jgi:hypothetical protein
MGALIAFEQDANLDEFVVAQGIPVESTVTRELLVSLFVPESVNKLHDGAVIIRNLRIAKAGVFFPMPESRIVDTSLGSRHRAAIGITEETDAVVVVVSEERGTISFCFSGNIVSNLDGASLRQALLGLFGRKARKKGSKKVPPPVGRPSFASVAAARPSMTTPIPSPAPVPSTRGSMTTPVPSPSPVAAARPSSNPPPPSPAASAPVRTPIPSRPPTTEPPEASETSEDPESGRPSAGTELPESPTAKGRGTSPEEVNE